MILPTLRAALGLASIALLALLAYITPHALDVIAVAYAAWLAAVLLDGLRAAAKRTVTLERDVPESFSVGRNTLASYRWAVTGRRGAHLLVREVLPDLLGGAREARRVEIPRAGICRETVGLEPKRRGRETGGWIAVRSLGPWGLAFRQWRLERPWHVTVYPNLPASRLRASIAEAVRHREPGARDMRFRGEGRQFESLREWVPGDDTRHIDWKATARRRKLITREFEAERRQQVLLVIDAGRLLTAEVAGEARLEFVVRAALWLAFAANHFDDNVGVMVFSDEVDHYVPPQRARRGLQQVLNVLAVVEAKLVEPDYPAAFRYLAIRNRKRALTVVFTDVIDRLASQALVANLASLRPRHLPLVVTLRNPDLDAVASARPSEVGAAYRKAAAAALLASRDDALAQMRHSGAVVLDVPPERASGAVVEAYLELKRRGRL